MCIDKRYRCDGTFGDCADYSDEENCPNKCNSTQAHLLVRFLLDLFLKNFEIFETLKKKCFIETPF